jgi:hypothetical protein
MGGPRNGSRAVAPQKETTLNATRAFRIWVTLTILYPAFVWRCKTEMWGRMSARVAIWPFPIGTISALRLSLPVWIAAAQRIGCRGQAPTWGASSVSPANGAAASSSPAPRYCPGGANFRTKRKPRRRQRGSPRDNSVCPAVSETCQR